ncbi:glycosyltransferase family 2 protein [Sphingomonas sp. S2-65]|uniref:glycosyltransferase family 2 protein n=1 Tax=Sphingomonas sp. S2-65 TaxID=2903960 RepID=UPI001F44B3D8|nr:glycosyltransferase [Sphingomonas sp. S2-65]UYY57067.1 glycosyltransferase [Sphingomonas sp. S2-65]
MVDVTLILCTRNRAAGLGGALNALAGAVRHAPPAASIELVIVDNGSTDGTAAVIERFQCQLSNVLAIYEPRPGLSAARNAGLGVATGRLVAFTDDDCEVSPAYFAQMLEHFGADEEPAIRGGRVNLGDPLDLPITIKVAEHPAELTKDMMPAGFIHGCNMAMPRSIFATLGIFDERLGAGSRYKSGEDTDLFLRAAHAGIAIRYVPDMSVTHFHGRRTVPDLAKLTRQYEYGNGALLMKHLLRSPILAKSFYWNAKDVLLERLGRRSSIVAETGVSRFGILCENSKGAGRFLLESVLSPLLGRSQVAEAKSLVAPR